MPGLAGAAVLVTGGTGSVGRAVVAHLLAEHAPRRVVVFSRDEHQQHDLRVALDHDRRVQWVLGDVRDRARLTRAMHGIDHVVHAAALKRVDGAELNPTEYVDTNVHGSQNVIEAAIDAQVGRVVALSTDKASSPVNLYGATKLCADRMFIAANHDAAGHPTRFAVVRHGNVLGSRGSVVEHYRRLAGTGQPLPVTDPRMTRFWVSLPDAVRFVVESLEQMTGGELFVPRTPSMRVVDLARAIAPGAPTYDVGIRAGEKLHEEMIAPDDARRTLDLGDRYLVMPHVAEWGYTPPSQGTPVPDGWSYRSDTNDDWLDADRLLAALG
jgi:UDP-N-acetylglucosamine 4,6-dehydratase